MILSGSIFLIDILGVFAADVLSWSGARVGRRGRGSDLNMSSKSGDKMLLVPLVLTDRTRRGGVLCVKSIKDSSLCLLVSGVLFYTRWLLTFSEMAAT